MTIPELIPRPRVVVHGGEPPTSSGPNVLTGTVTDRISARAHALPQVGLSLRFSIVGAESPVPTLGVDESY